MKLIAIFAALVPWGAFAFSLAVRDIVGEQSVPLMGLLWLVMSPLWFAGGCLVAYKLGQENAQCQEK